eukprot:15080449-Alexandrium_andersonii.AAC.1
MRMSRPQYREEFTGEEVLHGIHPLSLASILEHGTIQPSAGRGHEFTGLGGVYTCPRGQVTPFGYATPWFIKGAWEAPRPTGRDAMNEDWAMPPI